MSVRRQVQRRLSPAERVALVRGYQDGATMAALAQRFGVHEQTVSKTLHDLAVPLRKPALTDDERAHAIELYNGGWSLAKVGQHFGREHTVIRDVLVRADIPRRDSHGRPH